MDEENQLERELENAVANMPPVPNLGNAEDADTNDENNLIVAASGQPTTAGQDEGEQSEGGQNRAEARQQHREAVRQRLLDSPAATAAAGAGSIEDLTTIEIMSSNDDDSVPDAVPSLANRNTATPKATTAQNDSSNDDDDEDKDKDKEEDDSYDENDNDQDNRVSDDSDSEEDNLHYSTTEDSDDDAQEANFQKMLKEPEKPFSQLVKLCEVAFKLKDFDKIELALKTIKEEATVPAHIWVKYLKAYHVVTQTPEEHKQFEIKCCTALSFHYNIPLAEFIVGYLEDHTEQLESSRLWVKLITDYDVERPDFGLKLREKIARMTSNVTRNAYLEPLRNDCATWTLSMDDRQAIIDVVSNFKTHIADMKIQQTDWDWAKMHTPYVNDVLALNLNNCVKNSVIRFIFERTVSKFPTADALWLAYIQFVLGDDIDDNVDVDEAELAAQTASRIGKGFLQSTGVDLAKRAFRCRPTTRLNHKLLALMELENLDLASVNEQFQAMVKRTSRNLLMTVELYLDYLAYRIRNTNADNASQVTSLREAFFKSWEDLSELYGDQADTSYEILQLWAQVEYSHLRSPSNGYNIWRQILGYPGTNLRGQLWVNFAQMESEYNGGQGTRDILQEALAQPYMSDGQMVHELFRRYERCFGNYDTIAACQATNIPSDYAAMEFHSRSQNNRTFSSRRSRAKKTTDKDESKQTEEQRKSEKQEADKKEASGSAKADAAPVPAKSEAPSAAKSEAPLPAANPLAKLVTQTYSPKSSGFEVRPFYSKYSHDLEANKVFVKNVHPDCTKAELGQLFNNHGNIKDVRLIFKRKGMRGIAYVEYDKPEEANNAVAKLNNHKLRDIAISVMISNPPPRAKSQGFPASNGNVGVAKVAPKRRMLTSLIPTTVVRQEAEAAKKRRIESTQDADDAKPSTSAAATLAAATSDAATSDAATSDAATSVASTSVAATSGASSSDAATSGASTSTESNGKPNQSAPKTNDDFRNMFFRHY
ncbi:RNA-binding protein 4F [Drosophila serrata]|uniref:RNA-binding protein 4F n=1 Tax=Drosophila serrata TaxID=7274 RepID=UPI000A1D1C86|nr:RNA-binding protein 4F [Drosophila serrata]